MRKLSKLSNDARRISVILGLGMAARWLAAVALKLPAILIAKNLQSADRAMGEGPFRVRYRDDVSFSICGPGAFSGIREMYARDTYLHGGACYT